MTEDEFEAIWTNLVERSHNPDGPPLSQPERCFYTVNLLRGSVPRSGFIGYFENCTGPEIAAAHQGLRALGLQSTLDLLDQAQHVVLAGKPLPEDDSPIEIFPDSMTEEEFETESERIDEAVAPIEQEFYSHDEAIWNALCDYAESHQLKPPSE